MDIRDKRFRMLIYIIGSAIYLGAALYYEFDSGDLSKLSIYYLIFLGLLCSLMVFTAIYILTTVKHPERKLKANALASATGFYLLCTYFIFGLEYIVLLIGGILLLMDGVLGLNEK